MKHLLMLLLLLHPIAAFSQTTKPVDLARLQEGARKKYEQDQKVDAIPKAEKACKISDLVHFIVDKDRIKLDSKAGIYLGELQQVRVSVEDWPGTTIVGSMTPEHPSIHLNISNANFADPAAVQVQTSINWYQQRLTVQRQSNFPGGGFQNVIFTQVNEGAQMPGQQPAQRTLRLQVFRRTANGALPSVDVTAQDFATLGRQAPAEVRTYLRPLQRELHLDDVMPLDQNLAWQVFQQDWKPDPKVEEEVRKMLADLDADEFAKREQASKNLQAKGRDAAVVIMHMDRLRFTEQQNQSLDNVLSGFQSISPEEAARLGKDGNFLLDCLYAEEVEIREAALKRLREIAKEKIDEKLKADAPIPAETIEALRKQLAPATQP